MRLVVGITGATGVAIGVRVLEALRELDVETHLVISRWGRATIALECGASARKVSSLATHAYAPDALAAPIASGSFRIDGVVVMPCTARTLDQLGLAMEGTPRWAGPRADRPLIGPPTRDRIDGGPGDPRAA